MSTLEQRLSELHGRISEIDRAIDQLNTEYNSVAAEFSSGDKDTLRKAEQIEQKIIWLKREKSLAEAAQQQAEIAIQHDAQVREQETRHAVAASAREIASALTTIAHELDDAMLAMRQLFERRHAVLRELQTTGIADGVATRFMQKGVATRAAVHWGLAAHLDIHRCAPDSALPFSSADPVLRSIGKTNGSGNVEGET
jgi:hypothetical protein